MCSTAGRVPVPFKAQTKFLFQNIWNFTILTETLLLEFYDVTCLSLMYVDINLSLNNI